MRRPRSAAPEPSTGRERLVLTGMGGVIVLFLITVAGATVDVLIGDGRLGAGTTIGLALGATIVTLLTRRSDLLSVVVAPPLLYVLVAALSVLLRSTQISAASVVSWLSAGFPAMALATGIALVISGVRLVAAR